MSETMPLTLAARCALCARPFAASAKGLGKALRQGARQPGPSPRVLALTCSDCGSGGKSAHHGCLVRITGIEQLQAPGSKLQVRAPEGGA